MSQPQNPQYQPNPQQPWGPPPPPPKKRGAGKIIGFGCLGIVGLFVVIGIIAALAGGGSNSDKSSSSADGSSNTGTKKDDKPAGSGKTDDTKNSGDSKSDKKTVVFKVWGTAPAGALGPLDITYGSDSDNRKGKFANGEFTATLPLSKDAMYYSVTAQLQGSGDIHCSVTIGDKTKKGHASGGYNICQTQLNAGLLGGWD
ncbi:hypothetical protein ABZ599_35570 [Streptomyces misionensis]|uniref:hypothetical protein n=1 Tax=Streptomyces misionensis TaxID=67331 RepID=UPI0033ED2E7E